MWDNSCGPCIPDHRSWLPVSVTAELNRRLIWLGAEECLTPEQWNTKWLWFQDAKFGNFFLNSKNSVPGSPFVRDPHSSKEWLNTLDALLPWGCMCLGLFCLLTVWDLGLGYVGVAHKGSLSDSNWNRLVNGNPFPLVIVFKPGTIRLWKGEKKYCGKTRAGSEWVEFHQKWKNKIRTSQWRNDLTFSHTLELLPIVQPSSTLEESRQAANGPQGSFLHSLFLTLVSLT